MTSRKKFSALTWSSVAFAAVLAPQIAAAQAAGDDRGVGVRERVKPEYEPLGIRAGAFMIRPELQGEVEYNDNVFATDGVAPSAGGTGAEQDDFIYRVIPSVDVRSDWSRNEVGLLARLVNSTYQDFSGEDTTDWNVLGNGRLDLGVRSSIRASAGYTVAHESRTDGASPTTALEPVETKSTLYSVGATHEFNRLRIAGDVARRENDYEDAPGAPDQDVRDFTQTEYTGRADYALPKGGVVFVEGGYNTREYDLLTPQLVGASLNQDSSGYRALIGTRVDISNLLRGEVAVGYMNQDYDDSRLSSASGVAARADLQWFVTGITTIGFGGAREVQESGIFGGVGLQGGGVISSSVYGRVDHELLRNVVLSGDVAYRDYDYKNFDRNDNLIEAGLGAEYLANRVLSFGLEYRYLDRTSDGADRANEFSANSILFRISARL